jgi:hypothetical protein
MLQSLAAWLRYVIIVEELETGAVRKTEICSSHLADECFADCRKLRNQPLVLSLTVESGSRNAGIRKFEIQGGDINGNIQASEIPGPLRGCIP